MRTPLSFVMASVVLLAGLLSTPAAAARAKVIPFSGEIDKNGTPFSGAAALNFALFNCPTPCTDASTPVYVASAGSNGRAFKSDDNAAGIPVTANDGRFSVLLGDDGMEALPTAVFDAQFLFVRIAIKGDNTWFVLTGFQRIAPVAMAVTAQEAQTFTVRSTLTVNGLLTANAGISANALQVRKNGGTTSRIGFEQQTNDPGEIVHKEDNNVGELWLSSSDDWQSGVGNDEVVFGDIATNTRRHEFFANGNAKHTGTLTVSGSISKGAQVCTTRATPCTRDGIADDGFAGGDIQLFWQAHAIECGNDEFLRAWRPEQCGFQESQIRFTCCHL